MILAILLPTGLYYYFIATKRESLLNNFLAILDRLGLFARRRLFKSQIALSSLPNTLTIDLDLETEFGREKRVRSYFERFEALYGSLPDKFIAETIDAATRPRREADPNLTVSLAAPLSLRNILPVVSVMILSFIGWIVTLPLRISTLGPTPSYFLPNLTPVAFAFLGAYFFSLQLLIWRFVRKDLSPNAYLSVALRILLAMIGIWVVNQGIELFQADLDIRTRLVVAFAIGVFPVIVWQFIVGIVKRIPGVAVVLPNLKQGLALSELDGLTIWHETRLEEEDIENVANMASSDVVDLLLNTRFSPNRVIDWVDQAILFTSISAIDEEAGKKCRKRLEALGIRSATALLKIAPSRLLADHTVQLGENLTIKISDWVQLLAETIRTFPNLRLVQTWKGIEEEPPVRALIGSPLIGPGPSPEAQQFVERAGETAAIGVGQ